MKPRLIVFSSTESLNIARYIQTNLYPQFFAVQLWSNGFFSLSKSYMDNFENIQDKYDYAIIILKEDDTIITREKTIKVARDNVILEMGICIGAFSLDKVIIVKPNSLVLPSDLLGITTCDYFEDNDLNVTAGTICARIENYIENRKSSIYKLPWNEYFRNLKKLIEIIRKSPNLGGFNVDAFVGINGGGLLAADLIAREYGTYIPIVPLNSNRKDGYASFDTSDTLFDNKEIIAILQKTNIKNILILDNLARTGKGITNAKIFLESNLKSKNIKNAVVLADIALKSKCKIDFVADYMDLSGVKLCI